MKKITPHTLALDGELFALCQKKIGCEASAFYNNLPHRLRSWMSFEDLIQEGNVVLLECLRTYKPGKKIAFGTYLSASLATSYKQILEYHSYKKRDFRVPVFSIDAEPTVVRNLAVPFDSEMYRVELRMALQSSRSHVSRKGQALIDVVVKAKGGESVQSVSRKLRTSAYKVKQTGKELKKIFSLEE